MNCTRCGIPEANDNGLCDDCQKEYDSWFSEDEPDDCDDDEIIGYQCSCCGHIQDSNDWGCECEIYCAASLDEIYF